MIEFSTAFYMTFGFALFTGIVGYYVGEKGWAGVQNDLNNVKLDIANLKGHFYGPAAVTTIPVITTPKAGPVTAAPATTPA